MSRRRMKGFTVVELACLVALLACLAAVIIPAFRADLRREKTTEAIMNLRKLYDSTVSYYEAEDFWPPGAIEPRMFPVATGWNPAPGSCCLQPGGKCAPFVAAWQTVWTNPTWQALTFGIDDPFYYSYRTVAELGPAQHRAWTAPGASVGDVYKLQATGDLDCDGTYSLYERTATIDEQYNVTTIGGLFILNDVE
jgi:hypothetical protein